MLAALVAREQGAEVTLLERNEKLGKKLYITGKGRCNLTNAADSEAFLSNVVRNPRFLYAAFSRFSNQDMMALMERLGVPLKVERGGRVFPVSDRSSDVTRALERQLDRLGVRVVTGARVERLLVEDGRAAGVALTDGRVIYGRAVILATGGLSYPSTGSTGDGHALAKQAGHALAPARPALVPIETEQGWPQKLMGLSLKNVRLTASQGKKRLFSEQGEMLFTHFGVSGPLVLSLSSSLPESPRGVELAIDLKPALTAEVLDKRLLRDFQELSRKQFITVLDGLAPHSLALVLAELSGIAPARAVNGVTQQERRTLLQLIKRLPLTVKGLRGFDEAIITRGGVKTGEVNPSTMESKRLPGLYFAGELLDVDALTGGYNLQIAFSTGALAGVSAARAETG